MSIEALIFDVDGTLADTEEAHRQAFNAAFLEHGLPWAWSSAHYASLLGVSGGKQRLALHVERLAADPAEKARLSGMVPFLHRTKVRIFAELVERGGVPLRTGVARLLAEARAAGVRLALASGTSATNVSALVSAALGPGALSWFRVIACGDLGIARKPAPDAYRLALASLGLGAGRCIAFEDSANGVRAAKAAGLLTIVTPTQWTRGQDLRSADLVLPSLGDPGAALPPSEAAKAGGPWLGLREIEAFAAERHAAAASTPGLDR